MPYIGPGAVVCSTAQLVGDITIGARTVVHPGARIVATSGPVIIGEDNIVEEGVEIVNDAGEEAVMIIGNSNIFEVGSESHSLKIGNRNILEAKSFLGTKTFLSYGCVVGAGCKATSAEILPEMCAVTGGDCDRRVMDQVPGEQKEQRDLLAKVLPAHHKIMKAEEVPEEEIVETKQEMEKSNISSRTRTFNRLKSLIKK